MSISRTFCALLIALCLTLFSNVSAQWKQVNGRSLPWVRALMVHGGRLLAGCGGSAIADSMGAYRSSDNGVTWTHLVEGLPKADVPALASTGVNIFAATRGNGIFRSSDEGDHWVAVNTGLNDLSVYSLAVSDTVIFAGTASGSVYRSLDQGATWSGIAVVSPGPVSALCAAGKDVYAGGQYATMIHCANDGTGLREISIAGIQLPVAGMRRVGSYLYCALSNLSQGGGVFVSTNDGVRWESLSAGLPSLNVCSLFSTDSTLIAGTTYLAGVYYCKKGGPWVDIHAGLPTSEGRQGYPHYTVEALAVSADYLFAAGKADAFGGNGIVWRRPLSETSITAVANEGTPAPDRFELHQNYPNPFNPSTTISFELPSRSFVSLKIYDVMGREVSTIVSEELPAGNYRRQWNAVGCPSGVYFYRLQAGAHMETKRLVVLK